MFEELKAHRQAVQENIEKAFEIGFTGNDDFEKAHQVGDIHPNGKWVWTQLPSGKFDWRVIKKKDGQGTDAPAARTASTQQATPSDDIQDYRGKRPPAKGASGLASRQIYDVVSSVLDTFKRNGNKISDDEKKSLVSRYIRNTTYWGVYSRRAQGEKYALSDIDRVIQKWNDAHANSGTAAKKKEKEF